MTRLFFAQRQIFALIYLFPKVIPDYSDQLFVSNGAQSEQKKESKMGQPKQKTETTALHCSAENCKSQPARFEFCTEHYNQFKFGLITKLGKPVPDYEKKYDHYVAFQKRNKTIRKAA